MFGGKAEVDGSLSTFLLDYSWTELWENTLQLRPSQEFFIFCIITLMEKRLKFIYLHLKQKTTASQTLWALDPCWNRLNFAPLYSIYSTAAYLEAQMHLDIITKSKECLALRIAQSIFRLTVHRKARVVLGWCTEQSGGEATKKKKGCSVSLSCLFQKRRMWIFFYLKMNLHHLSHPQKNKKKNCVCFGK